VELNVFGEPVLGMRYRFAVNHNENQMTVRAGIDNVANEN